MAALTPPDQLSQGFCSGCLCVCNSRIQSSPNFSFTVAKQPAAVPRGRCIPRFGSSDVIQARRSGRRALGLHEFISIEPSRHVCVSVFQTLVDQHCTDSLRPQSARCGQDSRRPSLRKSRHCWDRTGIVSMPVGFLATSRLAAFITSR